MKKVVEQRIKNLSKTLDKWNKYSKEAGKTISDIKVLLEETEKELKKRLIL